MTNPNHLIIHGRGMMASVLRSASDIDGAVFAAGISNSLETDEREYVREKTELLKFIRANPEKRIIYFSSFVAATGQTRYARHKRDLELLISEEASRFIVLRLPQVVGRTSNRTLVNYLVGAARNRESITVQKNAVRRLVDADDIGRIITRFIAKGVTREIIAVGPSSPLLVLDIVAIIESILGTKFSYTLIDRGDQQPADLSRAVDLLGPDDSIFSADYQTAVLEKYVPLLFDEVTVTEPAFCIEKPYVER